MYVDVNIVENRCESQDTCTLFFDQVFDAQPGQFLMAWLPGVGEKPYSFSHPNAITVKQVGPFSKALATLKEGARLALRGPLGKEFPLVKGDTILVGGGCGIAPLRFLSEKLETFTALLGGRTGDDILFLKEFQKRGEVQVTTEDGSLGKNGLVTDLLPKPGEWAFVCGPEPMMAACLGCLSQDKGKTFAAIERYMKCAIGLCGTCTCSGYRVCVDGPVFDAVVLAQMSDFGTRRRAMSGRYEIIKGSSRLLHR